MAKKETKDFSYYSKLVRTDPVAAEILFAVVFAVFVTSGMLLKPAFVNRRNVSKLLEEKENDYE